MELNADPRMMRHDSQVDTGMLEAVVAGKVHGTFQTQAGSDKYTVNGFHYDSLTGRPAFGETRLAAASAGAERSSSTDTVLKLGPDLADVERSHRGLRSGLRHEACPHRTSGAPGGPLGVGPACPRSHRPGLRGSSQAATKNPWLGALSSCRSRCCSGGSCLRHSLHRHGVDTSRVAGIAVASAGAESGTEVELRMPGPSRSAVCSVARQLHRRRRRYWLHLRRRSLPHMMAAVRSADVYRRFWSW